MIRLLISSLLLALLTGCVSPYYAMRDSGQASYEAAQGAPYQDAYYGEEYDVPPAYDPAWAYYDSTYYPWRSLDYFYLGGPYYDPYYGPYYGPSFSFSLSSGFPYYDPRYDSAYYPGWNVPYYEAPWFRAYYGWGGGYSRYSPYRHRGNNRDVHRWPRHDGVHERDRVYRGSRRHERGGGDSPVPDRDYGGRRPAWNTGRDGRPQPRGTYRPRGGNDLRGRQPPAVAPNDRVLRSRTRLPGRPGAPAPAVPAARGYPSPSPIQPSIPSRPSPGPGPAAPPATRYSVPARPAVRQSSPYSPARQNSAPGRARPRESGADGGHPEPGPNGRTDHHRRKYRP